MSDTVKYLLEEEDIPKTWYNIVADLPEPPAAVLHPGTGQPVGPDDLAPLFPMAIITIYWMQEIGLSMTEIFLVLCQKSAHGHAALR